MDITSLDILNLSHSLKDVSEVNCKTPECLSQALKALMEYNLIQANLEFARRFSCCKEVQKPIGAIPPDSRETQTELPIIPGVAAIDITNAQTLSGAESDPGHSK